MVQLFIAGNMRLAGSLHWAYLQLIATTTTLSSQLGFIVLVQLPSPFELLLLPHAGCGLPADSVSVGIYNGTQRLCNIP